MNTSSKSGMGGGRHLLPPPNLESAHLGYDMGYLEVSIDWSGVVTFITVYHGDIFSTMLL